MPVLRRADHRDSHKKGPYCHNPPSSVKTAMPGYRSGRRAWIAVPIAPYPALETGAAHNI
jgi:hypothetical protein